MPLAPQSAPPADLPAPARRSGGGLPVPFVAAWATVALVVAGGIVTVLLVRAAHAPPTGSRSASGRFGGTVATRTTEPTDSGELTDTGEPTDTAEPTDTGGSDSGDQTDGPPVDPYGVVTMADTVAVDPAAPEVMSVLSTYFQAINTRDYALYQSIHTPDAQATLDEGTFDLGFESTVDSDALVTAIGVQVDGRPTAEVTFTSRQDSVDGPDGDTCDHWNVTFFLTPQEDGSYLVDTAPDTYHASHEPC